MRFRHCRLCGEYKYIKSKGVCPECFPTCDINHISASGNGSFLSINLSSLQDKIEKSFFETTVDSILIGVEVEDNNNVSLAPYSGMDEPNIRVTRSGRYSIDSYEPESCKSINALLVDIVSHSSKCDSNYNKPFSISSLVSTIRFKESLSDDYIELLVTKGLLSEKVGNTIIMSSQNEKESEKKLNDAQEVIINLEAN
jgi:hypothetical protein